MSIKRELSEKVNARGKYDRHQASRPDVDRRTSDELDALLSRYVDNGVQHHLEAAAGRSVRSLSDASQAGKAEHASRCKRAAE